MNDFIVLSYLFLLAILLFGSCKMCFQVLFERRDGCAGCARSWSIAETMRLPYLNAVHFRAYAENVVLDRLVLVRVMNADVLFRILRIRRSHAIRGMIHRR